MESQNEQMLINPDLVAEMKIQASYAMTHEMETEMPAKELGTVAPLLPEAPAQTSLEVTEQSRIQRTASFTKDFIQFTADGTKTAVDAVDGFSKRTVEVAGEIKEFSKELSKEGEKEFRLAAEDVRRFAQLAINWIEAKAVSAKENVSAFARSAALNTKLAGKIVANKGQSLAISATRTADDLSVTFFDTKESMKRRVRSLSQSANDSILSLTEPKFAPQLSRFDLSLPEALKIEEPVGQQTLIVAPVEERVAHEQLVKEIESQSEVQPSGDLKPSRLTQEISEAKTIRESLQKSIVDAQKEMVKAAPNAPIVVPSSIRSN